MYGQVNTGGHSYIITSQSYTALVKWPDDDGHKFEIAFMEFEEIEELLQQACMHARTSFI